MQKIDERFLISSYLVFFVIHSNQIGIGVLGFQRIIVKSAGSDGWIAIIIAAISIHIILWMIYKMLNNSGGDIISIHKDTFGKWLGGLFSIIFVIYFLLVSLTVLRTYIEVLQVWMFPEINIWIFSIFFLLITFYIISGGFRVVAGICFFSVVLPIYLLFIVAFPLQFAEFRNLLPIFDHSINEVILATKDMTLSMIGFEVLLLFYPFIKKPKKSKKWAHFAIMFTTFAYVLYGVTALVFFSEGQLEKHIWPTLSMWKIVEMPFVERFEFIGIATWLFVILPNVCLGFWGASRGIKRLFSVRQKTALVILMVIVLGVIGMTNSRNEINFLTEMLSQIGFYLVYIYLPILFLISTIVYKVRK